MRELALLLIATACFFEGLIPPKVKSRRATYRISDDGKSITCLKCGWTSYHPKDVSERYCGHCHIFHAR